MDGSVAAIGKIINKWPHESGCEGPEELILSTLLLIYDAYALPMMFLLSLLSLSGASAPSLLILSFLDCLILSMQSSHHAPMGYQVHTIILAVIVVADNLSSSIR